MTARLHKDVPRGTVHVSDKVMAIVREVEESGKSRAEIASDFGVSRHYVGQCIRAVFDARRDAENLRRAAG